MSSIRAEVGSATVELSGVDTVSAAGVAAVYRPQEVLDAAAQVLRAVGTPRAVQWAQALLDITTLPNLGPRRTPPTEET